MPVEAVTVTSTTLHDSISAVGSLLANESIVLRPEISGVVAAIHFSEGQAVKQHALLLTLDQAEAKARAAESDAQAQVTRLSFERAGEIFKNKLISRQQHDEAEAQYLAAKARAAVEQERLNKTSLRAPFDGVVGLRLVSPGEFVQPGQALVEIVDQHILKLEFRIPEIYLSRLHNGLLIQVSTDAYPNQLFDGEVYAIAPNVNVANRSIAVRARVKNPDALLRAGLFAQVTLQLAQRDKAVLIPEEALWPIGDQQNVYKVVEGKAMLAPIKIGLRQNGQVEITEGLLTGEQIIVAGQMKIQPGMPVMVLPPPGSTPAGAH
jgi:membrane fusion protein (multidrug efflux system)